MSESAGSTHRVLLACESTIAGRGGIARVARLMARVLGEEMRRGVLEAEALTLSDDEPATDLGIPVETARGSRARFVYRLQRAALSHDRFIYDFAGLARGHGRLPLLRRPYLTFLHGIEVWEGARPDRLRAARRADALVCNSRYTRDRAEAAHGGFQRARVCWLATEDDDPPERPPDPDAPPSALILGRIEMGRPKGHEDLIQAWPAVVDAVPEARLTIAGEGSGLDGVRRQAAASPAGSNIDVLGFVREEEVESLWSRSTLFAMPSRGEGFGLVYAEAMRHGLPVIASVHDAAPEVNLNEETGYNVDLHRSGELADRLVSLLRDRGLASRLGGNGRRRWARHFRYGAFRDRVLPLLREFLEGGGLQD